MAKKSGWNWVDVYKRQELFRDLYNSLLNTQCTQFADTYFILKDFHSYADAQKWKSFKDVYKRQVPTPILSRLFRFQT